MAPTVPPPSLRAAAAAAGGGGGAGGSRGPGGTSIGGGSDAESEPAEQACSRDPRHGTARAARNNRVRSGGRGGDGGTADVGRGGRDGLKSAAPEVAAGSRKRYAWMDSDDDACSGGSRSDRSEEVAGEKKQGGGADDNEGDAPLPSSAADVSSFSEMVRMAPDLQRRVRRMAAAELASVLTAAARVRFYDGPLLDSVTAELRRALNRHGISVKTISTGEMVKVLGSLAQLNAYDRELFGVAARHLSSVRACDHLDNAQRAQLLEAFRSVKHQGDEAFVEALSRRVKSERYEADKEALWKRSLTRMYGETLDLQGPSEDAERAMLKRRRRDVVRDR